MASEAAHVLVWGASPEDSSPLFPGRESLKALPPRPIGPEAGTFRTRVRDDLNNRFSTYGGTVKAVFSEDWETFGHSHKNPGLYEPLQLEKATLVLLLLPGPRSLGVNTWELALALENPTAGQTVHFDKLIILLPETVYHYVRAVLHANVTDPKDFKMQEATGTTEPELGAANSFAARWLVLAMRQHYCGMDPWARISQPMPIAYYPDTVSWDLYISGTTDLSIVATEIIDKLIDLVERRLPVP